jgi:hypothetical protein
MDLFQLVMRVLNRTCEGSKLFPTGQKVSLLHRAFHQHTDSHLLSRFKDRTFYEFSLNLLGPTDPCSTAVHMEPFSSLALKGLT